MQGPRCLATFSRCQGAGGPLPPGDIDGDLGGGGESPPGPGRGGGGTAEALGLPVRELGGKVMAGQAWNLEQRGASEVVAVTAGPWAGTALLVRQDRGAL